MTVDIKDPFVQKAALAGLGLAGLLYLYFGTAVVPFCYRPQVAAAQEIRETVNRLSGDLARAKATAEGLKSLESQYARLERDWKRAQDMLPEKSEIPRFLAGVTRSGLDCGLEVRLFEPKKTVGHGFFTESPVAMKVAGQYHQVGEFLARVSSLPRLVNVDRLQIREQMGVDDGDHTVEMELILSAYYLEDDMRVGGGAVAPTSEPAVQKRGEEH
ncbi:MAG: type 4a pilus biogenesis protein PilO [Candidatus Eisenbacteria sp.]|nr:type 4a pilus biogenesis protein PilO [Candidatus Eisenbacteria bacterium]